MSNTFDKARKSYIKNRAELRALIEHNEKVIRQHKQNIQTAEEIIPRCENLISVYERQLFKLENNEGKKYGKEAAKIRKEEQVEVLRLQLAELEKEVNNPPLELPTTEKVITYQAKTNEELLKLAREESIDDVEIELNKIKKAIENVN